MLLTVFRYTRARAKFKKNKSRGSRGNAFSGRCRRRRADRARAAVPPLRPPSCRFLGLASPPSFSAMKFMCATAFFLCVRPRASFFFAIPHQSHPIRFRANCSPATGKGKKEWNRHLPRFAGQILPPSVQASQK